ncbi:MAG: hypothetical protein KJ626_04870 [Verrucomicrobia bacterium]|nr:hypothetical protein [Verrucomicrobiota bacterium]
MSTLRAAQWFIGLAFFAALLAVSPAETVTVSRRVAAYSPDNPRKMKGYFPSGADLEVLGDAKAGMVKVRFVSPSGKEVIAACRRVDLGLPPAAAVAASLDRDSPDISPKSGSDVWNEVSADRMDTKELSDRGKEAMSMPGLKWRHAQTDHFVVHYEHGIFARKVARMAEFYYDFISQDLKCKKDLLAGRSHIYIFRTEEKWKEFLAKGGNANDWAFSYVLGPAMFLQQADGTSSSADVLAHEMTHLVLNRFFRTRIPTWLNEGMAEWYGEFAYSAFKGIKKSQRAQFKRLVYRFPVDDLLSAETYPQDTESVHAFYQTSKFLVAYLRLEWPEENFIDLINEVMAGTEFDAALEQKYAIASRDDLAKGFKKFIE